MVEFDINLFAEKLKFVRECYDVSQHEVADILHIDRSTYSYYEIGKTQPNLSVLYTISQLFAVSLDDLINPNIKVSLRLFKNIEEIDFSKYYKMRTSHLKEFNE